MKQFFYILSLSTLMLISCQKTNNQTNTNLKIADVQNVVWTYVSNSDKLFQFMFRDNMILGNDACNDFSMNFNTVGEEGINIKLNLSTKKACNIKYPMIQDDLTKATKYKLKNGELIFTNNAGQAYKFQSKAIVSLKNHSLTKKTWNFKKIKNDETLQKKLEKYKFDLNLKINEDRTFLMKWNCENNNCNTVAGTINIGENGILLLFGKVLENKDSKFPNKEDVTLLNNFLKNNSFSLENGQLQISGKQSFIFE